MLTRIASITLGLASAGFVAGGVVGAVMMAGWMLVDGVPDAEMLLFGGMFGAGVGAVLGPLSAWLLMRHVPLGLAVGGIAAGTIAGALVGGVIGGFGASFVCALPGYGSAAVFLRTRAPDPSRAIRAPDAPALRG